MADDLLNSMHLEQPRRDAFRRARAGLMISCGAETHLAMNSPDASAAAEGPRRLRRHTEARLPPDMDYGLASGKSIYPLKTGLNTIGRLHDNDVVLGDAYVSRRHCAILVHATRGAELHDVASKNGVYVNGRRLSGPNPLASGDRIRLCDRHFTFLSRSGSTAGSIGPTEIS